MKVSEILKGMDSLLNAPDRWVQRVEAVNDAGISIPPESHQATSFCLVGAGQRVSKGGWYNSHAATPILRAINEKFEDDDGGPIVSVTSFNDKSFTTFDDVKLVLSRAIELAELEEVQVGLH